MIDQPPVGLTVADVAKLLRVGQDKVRAWIGKGELGAIDTAAVQCGRRRFVVLPDQLQAFLRRRSAAAPPKPRRKRRTKAVDFYPE